MILPYPNSFALTGNQTLLFAMPKRHIMKGVN